MKAKSRIVSLLTAALSAVLALILGVATLNIQPKSASAETGSYVKVTETPADWSGDYLIVYEKDGVIFDGSLSKLDAGNNVQKVTITNNTITGDYSAYTFTIDTVNTGYTIQSASGYYIGNTADSNGLASSTSTQYTNTITLNVDKSVQIVGSGKSVLRFNATTGGNTNYRFRYYKSSTYTGQKAICLYKYEEAVACEHTSTTCKSNEDGTHNVVCTDACGTTLETNVICTYENGVCECGYEENTPQLSIAVSGDAYTCVGGETITVVATAKNLTEEISWTSSKPTVATVENGVVTAVGMGKTTITAEADGLSATVDVIVYPEADTVLSIAETLEVCELTGNANSPYSYSTVGTIESIDEEYSSQYKNITVTITDGTNSIKAYRMAGGETLEVGNKIKVTGKLVNYSNNTPEFATGCTYELVLDDTQKVIQEKLDTVNAYMQLAYKYTTKTETVSVPATVTDTLNRDTTGVTSTTYTAWSGKKASASSDAVYAGLSAGDKTSIQLRSATDKNHSGVITTTSGGKATKVTVVWNSGTSDGRTLNVYGKNGVYESAQDLYSEDTQGTLLGTIVCGTSTELVIDGDYEYIGLRSNSGTLYLTSVGITWETDGEGGETKDVTTYSDSEFRFMCAVDASLAEIADLDVAEWGIRVTAGGKTATYTSTASSWTAKDGKVYVVISLGDIINDMGKLTTEFTVEAYAVCDDETVLTSVNEKTYSVKSIVKGYYGDSVTAVENLYNYLFGEVA